MTVVAAAAGDEPFGPTTDSGYGERRRCTLRLAAGLAVAPDFFRYLNKLLQICKIASMFWLFIEFFVSVGSSKTLHGLSFWLVLLINRYQPFLPKYG